MFSNQTIPCYPVREVVSNGVVQGDIPTHFALPLLIIQITVVLALTRTLAALIKPLHQPTVLAEVIGGVLLGPTGLGRNEAFSNAIFPKSSLTLLDTVSSMGLLFYMFLVGLELDLKAIRRSGKTAFIVALSGIALPFIGGIGVACLLRHTLTHQVNFGSFITLMGVPMSITAFPVLVRIMAERKLFKTDLGKVVLPTAALNDMCAWILLALGVALNSPSSNPYIPAYVLLGGVGYVLFMLFVMRRVMEWIAHRGSEEGNVNEIFVCVTMMGVLAAGFTTDAIGIHPLFGAFAYGVMVPKEGKFAEMLAEKIEDFVTVLMLPLFFASSGLKTNLSTINSARTAGYLVLLVMTACVGKISGTVIAALSLKMDLRTSFAFAFLMNTKGLVELIVLNIAKDIGVFDDQTFALLVLTCLIILFFTTPAVMALYKPARDQVPYINKNIESSSTKKDELRILACVHGSRGVPGLLNLVEACKGPKKRSMKLFVMHLMELSSRTSSIMTMSRAAQISGASISSKEDHIFVAFEAFGRFTKTPVRLLCAFSQLDDMHNDVCNMALEKRVTIIILPIILSQREDGSIEHSNQGLRIVHQRVLQYAPCSVGIYVDRGLWGLVEMSATPIDHNVALIFFGGPDDREALAFGLCIVEHPNVRLFVKRFIYEGKAQSDNEHVVDVMKQGENGEEVEKERDEESLAHLKQIKDEMKENPSSFIAYEELVYHDNPVDAVEIAVKSSDFSLVLVGKRTQGSMEQQLSRSSELGIVGEALANASGDLKASILVIQQNNPAFKCG